MAKKKTHSEFVKEVFELVGNDYEVIGEFKNVSTKIKMKHIVCNFEWEVRPSNFTVRSSRCPKCNGGVRNKTTEYFKQEVYELVQDEYQVVGEYKGNKENITFIHTTCNSQFDSRPNNFLMGSRCPNCFGTSLKTMSNLKRKFFN